MEFLLAHAHGKPEPNRRDVLYVATAVTGTVGAAGAIWPFIDQMNPAADVRALASIEVDVSTLEVGQQLTVKWRGKPVFIRKRTEAEIADSMAVDIDSLKCKTAENDNLRDAALPATDENRTLDEDGVWLVQEGICTHLGCVPVGDGAGEFGGWFCPCHGSHYDTLGRIRKGPAPLNLKIPVAKFTDDTRTVIRLG